MKILQKLGITKHHYPPHIRYPAKYLGLATPEEIQKYCRFTNKPKKAHKYTCCYRDCPNLVITTNYPRSFLDKPPRSCGCSLKPYRVPEQHLPILHSNPMVQPYNHTTRNRKKARYICRMLSGKGGTMCGKVFFAEVRGAYDPENGINTLTRHPRQKTCGCMTSCRQKFWAIPPEWRKERLIKTAHQREGAVRSKYEGREPFMKNKIVELPCRVPGCTGIRKVLARADAGGNTHLSCGCVRWKVKVPEEYCPTHIGEPTEEQMALYQAKYREKNKTGKHRHRYSYHLYRCNIPHNNGKVCNTEFVARTLYRRKTAAASCGCIKKKPFLFPRDWRIPPGE